MEERTKERSDLIFLNPQTPQSTNFLILFYNAPSNTKIPSTPFLDPKPVLPKQERKKRRRRKNIPNNPINVTRTSTSILFHISLPYQKFSRTKSFEISIISDCERQGWLNTSESFFHRRLIQPKRRRRTLVPLTKENTRRKLEIPVGQSDDAWPLTDSGSARRVNI